MNDWEKALAAEFEREVVLQRADPAEIYRRARLDSVVDRYAREARTLRLVGRIGGIVQLLTFDAVAASLIWSATAHPLLAGGAAALTHIAGSLAGAAREARA